MMIVSINSDAFGEFCNIIRADIEHCPLVVEKRNDNFSLLSGSGEGDSHSCIAKDIANSTN